MKRRRSALRAYARFLDGVSRRFARIAARNRDEVACRPGCFGCCVGLFEISPLDAALAARGMAKLPRRRREAIARRGEAIARRIAGMFPGDAATLRLDVARQDAWDAFFEKTSGIACPFLEPIDLRSAATAPAAARRRRWPQGFSCAIYADRPHACRTRRRRRSPPPRCPSTSPKKRRSPATRSRSLVSPSTRRRSFRPSRAEGSLFRDSPDHRDSELG